jgi:hypothetical protein
MAANSIGWHAQVVTPGISGTLSRVELGVWRSRDTTVPLIVDIVEIGEEMFYDTGRIAGRAVDASTVPVSNAEIRPAFTVSVDFSDSNIRLIAGQPFAILLRADNELGYGWAGNINDLDTYPGGGVYGYRLRPELITYKPRDAHFRTFVLVPEPGALGIAATSQFIVFARGRYARRSAA